MKRILKKLAILSYLKRRRVRAGFGVHSPNRYYYIRQVLFQKGMYYAYKSLPESKEMDTGLLRLLFRLANDCQAPRALLVTSSEQRGQLVAQYLDAGKRNIECQIVTSVQQVGQPFWMTDDTTLVYIDEMQMMEPSLMHHMSQWLLTAPDNSTCLCAGIHSSDMHELAWRSLWKGLSGEIGIYDMAACGVIKKEPRLPLRYLEI